MRKKLMILVAVLIGCVAMNEVNAQNVIEKGTSVVNIGLGVSNGSLPITVGYDYGITGNLFDDKSALTIGALGGALVGQNLSGFLVGPRLGLHYHFIPNLDTYLSIMLGYKSTTSKASADGIKVSETVGGFDWGTHVGARYMFNPKFGIFGEFGYGWSFANFGLAIRF